MLHPVTSLRLHHLCVIRTEESETWPEFHARATKAFRNSLGEYKEILKDPGEFKTKISRDARWLAANRVKGLSWAMITDSPELNPAVDECFDADSIRMAANRLAKFLPLTTPRT